MLTKVEVKENASIQEHIKYDLGIKDLIKQVNTIKDIFSCTTVWQINCTKRHGGVAELLVNEIPMMRQLGLLTEWLVMEDCGEEFQNITKVLHNNIHNEGEEGNFEKWRELYEKVNREQCELFVKNFPVKETDIVMIHDPQPAALGSFLRETYPSICLVWRCHIGHELSSDTTKALKSWNFLQPYLEQYDCAIFSAKEYVPHYLKQGKVKIVYPGINPLCYKNRKLSSMQIEQILQEAGITASKSNTDQLKSDKIITRKAVLHELKDETDKQKWIDFTQPIVAQISRWDSLKGMIPLLQGFALFLQQTKTNAKLLLGGPNVSFFNDDPQGKQYLKTLQQEYDKLPCKIRNNIYIFELPMENHIENALIVNAIQRSAKVMVQNSSKEAFGLTASECMLKSHACFLGTELAVGLRIQVRDEVDGKLVKGNPEDPKAVCDCVEKLFQNQQAHEKWLQNGYKRVKDNFLIYKCIAQYVEIFKQLLTQRNKMRRNSVNVHVPTLQSRFETSKQHSFKVSNA